MFLLGYNNLKLGSVILLYLVMKHVASTCFCSSPKPNSWEGFSVEALSSVLLNIFATSTFTPLHSSQKSDTFSLLLRYQRSSYSLRYKIWIVVSFWDYQYGIIWPMSFRTRSKRLAGSLPSRPVKCISSHIGWSNCWKNGRKPKQKRKGWLKLFI